MMDNMDQSNIIPPGFRFHPTDEELVGYYLKKKVASQNIDLDVIREINLYRIEPWDLQEKCRIGYEEESEWYFFSHKDKKYPTGTRTKRATMAGFWKATGRDKTVYNKSRLIGMRKTLVFYKGRAPNGQKTDWIMHEYRLESEENSSPQEEGWVVCRAFKKRTTGQTNSIESWDSNCNFYEGSSVISVMDSVGCMTKHPSNFLSQNFMCEQETEPDKLNFVPSDQFVQLPQLERPSLPLIKRQSSVPQLSERKEQNDEGNIRGCRNIKKVSDWRDLDKFVASQLSPEDKYEEQGASRFVAENDLDVGSFLFRNGEDEESKLDGFLSDVGICIFD